MVQKNRKQRKFRAILRVPPFRQNSRGARYVYGLRWGNSSAGISPLQPRGYKYPRVL